MSFISGLLIVVACEAGPLTRNSITIPIVDGHVVVDINGQRRHLLLDTGSNHLRVMDGEWYESKYGKSSCLEADRACFDCPGSAPCDFDNDPAVMTSYSLDGSTIKSLTRYGSLTLNGHRFEGFPFHVCREYSRTLKPPPKGYFGLGGPSLQRAQGHPGEAKNLLDALVYANAISTPIYSVRTHLQNGSRHISGELILGEEVGSSTGERQRDVGWFNFAPRAVHSQSLPSVQVDYVGLSSTQGKPLNVEEYSYHYHKPVTTPLDTGSDAVFLPLPTILDDMVQFLRSNLREKGYAEDEVSNKYLLKGGKLAIYKSIIDSLPIISMRMRDRERSTMLQLHPRQYCRDTALPNSCQVAVSSAAVSSLGTPFFLTYTTQFDFIRNGLRLFRN